MMATCQRSNRLLRSCFTHDGKAKRRYATRQAALEKIPPGQGAYECEHCNAWHRASF